MSISFKDLGKKPITTMCKHAQFSFHSKNNPDNKQLTSKSQYFINTMFSDLETTKQINTVFGLTKSTHSLKTVYLTELDNLKKKYRTDCIQKLFQQIMDYSIPMSLKPYTDNYYTIKREWVLSENIVGDRAYALKKETIAITPFESQKSLGTMSKIRYFINGYEAFLDQYRSRNAYSYTLSNTKETRYFPIEDPNFQDMYTIADTILNGNCNFVSEVPKDSDYYSVTLLSQTNYKSQK